MIYQTEVRKTLGWLVQQLPNANAIFSAGINPKYTNLINSIRDVVDYKDESTTPTSYNTNSVSECVFTYFANRELRGVFNHNNVSLGRLEMMLNGMYAKNKYEYEKMLDTLTMEINPLNMTDYTKTITKEFGLHIIDNEIGQKRSTDVNGAVNVTDTIGAHTDTKRNYATTMDNTTSGSEKLKEKEETVVGTHSDTHNTGTYTDTHTHDSSKDTKTDKAHTDTFTETITGNVDKDEMDLIQKYRDMAKFSLVMRIAKDISDALCVKTYNLESFDSWFGGD